MSSSWVQLHASAGNARQRAKAQTRVMAYLSSRARVSNAGPVQVNKSRGDSRTQSVYGEVPGAREQILYMCVCVCVCVYWLINPYPEAEPATTATAHSRFTICISIKHARVSCQLRSSLHRLVPGPGSGLVSGTN